MARTESPAAEFTATGLAESGATEDERRKHPNWPERVCPRLLFVSARKTGRSRGKTMTRNRMLSRTVTMSRGKGKGGQLRRVVSCGVAV